MGIRRIQDDQGKESLILGMTGAQHIGGHKNSKEWIIYNYMLDIIAHKGDYMALTTIQVETSTREELKKYGIKGEKYDKIIRRLVEIARRQEFYERQKRILETEEFVHLDKI